MVVDVDVWYSSTGQFLLAALYTYLPGLRFNFPVHDLEWQCSLGELRGLLVVALLVVLFLLAVLLGINLFLFGPLFALHTCILAFVVFSSMPYGNDGGLFGRLDRVVLECVAIPADSVVCLCRSVFVSDAFFTA